MALVMKGLGIDTTNHRVAKAFGELTRNPPPLRLSVPARTHPTDNVRNQLPQLVLRLPAVQALPSRQLLDAALDFWVGYLAIRQLLHNAKVDLDIVRQQL